MNADHLEYNSEHTSQAVGKERPADTGRHSRAKVLAQPFHHGVEDSANIDFIIFIVINFL